MNLLERLGWDDFFQQYYTDKQYQPARIIRKHNSGYDLICEEGVFYARIRGKLRKDLPKESWPAVGDWVLCSLAKEYAMIESLFPRKTKISRKVSGKTSQEQIIAANADVIFLVVSLYEDFNLRKIERYLALIAESKAQAVVILNKIDLIQDIEPYLLEMKKIVQDTPVITSNALDSESLTILNQYIGVGKTAVFLGSSGVGKSTIVNALLGSQIQAVGDINKHKKGQHTTSTRDMLFLKNGGILIDNPGVRELRVWLDGEEALNESFADIDLLAQQCRFRDCQHISEPDCAVQEAVQKGTLDQERLDNWRKLREESLELLQKRQEFGRPIDKSQSHRLAKWTKTNRKSDRTGLR
ncbi:MAG: ribosome small subunit-dependent GTPase A [Brevinema sp.]